MINTLTQFGARVKIDASNPIGAIIIAIIVVAAATGIVYGILDFLVSKIILPVMKVPEEKRDGHILSKIALIVTLLVLAAGVVMVILPAFGVDTGPLNLLNILG
ncbi:MAG: hypothetical protein LBG75_01855 [Candidatus Nomurabacteria bacterium]|jgi:hypothetical protein|nr:hypothetical protein [Candidatus Nomurabacteria bacterium]